MRKKIMLTLLLVVAFRIGQTLPTPNVNVNAAAAWNAARTDNQLYWLLDLLTGGALLQLSIFAFGILPYLVARALIRGLTGVSRRMAALRKHGEAGARALTRYTRFLTVGLGILAAYGLVTSARQDVLYDHGFVPLAVMVACMAAGTAVAMRLAELITTRGFGDGARLLLLAQIVAVLPAEFWRLYQAKGIAVVVVVITMVPVMVLGTIAVAQAQRRVPVQYAKRMIGRRAYGGTDSYIPIRFNQSAGPAITASVLLYLPVLAAQLWPGAAWLQAIKHHLHQEDNPWRMTAYFALIVLFAFAKAVVTADDEALTLDMAKTGAFVPGIRPGRPTAEYLEYVRRKIVTAGSYYLGAVALLPLAGFAILDAGPRFPFGGAAILLILLFLVDVALGTVKQVESLRMQNRYVGNLR